LIRFLLSSLITKCTEGSKCYYMGGLTDWSSLTICCKKATSSTAYSFPKNVR
jgi:hypothetical protein